MKFEPTDSLLNLAALNWGELESERFVNIQWIRRIRWMRWFFVGVRHWARALSESTYVYAILRIILFSSLNQMARETNACKIEKQMEIPPAQNHVCFDYILHWPVNGLWKWVKLRHFTRIHKQWYTFTFNAKIIFNIASFECQILIQLIGVHVIPFACKLRRKCFAALTKWAINIENRVNALVFNDETEQLM